MRKLFLVSLLFFGLSVSASAQVKAGTWSFIPRLGVDISVTKGDNFFTSVSEPALKELKAKYKPGFSGGLDVEYQASSLLAFSAGVYYTQQGAKFDDFSTTFDDRTGYGIGKHVVNLDYLGIPLMVHCNIANGFSVSAGLQPSLLINSKRTYEEQEFTVAEDGARNYEPIVEHEIDIDEMVNKFVLNLPVGVSYEYQNVILDAHYVYGITSAYKEPYGSHHNSMFHFTVGYRFKL